MRIDADRERLLSLFSKAGFPDWPFDFHGDERNRLSGPEISRLVLGHVLQGKVHSGSPAIMQIGKDGKWAFRSATLLITGTIFVSDNMLCQQSESLVALGRSDCGPVFRLNPGENAPAYAYVNATNIFYFSLAD